MKRQLLEYQANRIEAVLASNKVPARVTGGSVAPRWIRFQVLPALGARVNKVKGLAEEMALALGCDTCRISRQGGLIAVEIPRPDPQPVRLLPLQDRLVKAAKQSGARRQNVRRVLDHTVRRGIPFGTAVLGLADDGTPLLIRLPSPQVAHILIAGTTGSGKSALAQTIITSLASTHRPSQISFILIDPKRRAFGSLAGLPHLLRPMLTEPDTAAHTLDLLIELMLERDREGRFPASGGQSGDPRIVVVIDELADLLMMSGKKTIEAITRLSQRGREAGIHLIACTQKPASEVMGSLAKANFPVRLVGRVTSPEDAKVATGYGGTGAERLVGPGDFIAVTGGQLRRFQAAFVSTQEVTRLVSQMIDKHRRHPY
jgi:S-DNA-T family DNA segregation ATPase FtsK/SpoIIIE